MAFEPKHGLQVEYLTPNIHLHNSYFPNRPSEASFVDQTIAMLIAIVSAIFAVSYVRFATGNSIKHNSGIDAAFKCLQEGFNVESAYVQSAGGHIKTTAEKVYATCLFFEGMGPCLVHSAGVSPSTNGDYFNLVVASQWQHMVLANRSGVCEDMSLYEELRAIALQSGIMEKENLVNIEEDRYEPCAGEAMRKCFKEDEVTFENHFKDYNDNNAGYRKYVNCFKREAAIRCATPILGHFIAHFKAFQRYEDENHGKLESQVEQLKPKL